MGVLYAVTAAQGASGDPQWWPVAVSEVAVVALGAVGFTAGVLRPSRFTAPLAAIVVALVLRQTLRNGGTYALLSPTTSPAYSLEALRPDAGVFSPYLPDLSITRILFLGGLTVVALGLLGVQRVCGSPGLRRAAAVLVAVGLAASATASVLVATAKATATGVSVPALHDAADDRPIATPPSAPSPRSRSASTRSTAATSRRSAQPWTRCCAKSPGCRARPYDSARSPTPDSTPTWPRSRSPGRPRWRRSPSTSATTA
ncbi:hypothetical protein [Streptacidiphilus sp. PAMC 29251]